MYTNAQYVNGFDGKSAVINATNASGQFISIPLDPENSDYINIMKLVANNQLTIAPAP
jgi:hypothetical protein